MSVLTEGKHAGEFLVHELDGLMSRKIGTLNLGQNLEDGTVLGGLMSIGAATFVGTVGTRGTVTVASTKGPDTQVGTYRLICTAAAANAGTFQLRAPDGSLVAFDTGTSITVGGGAYTSDHLDITIADGATDFIVGDTYNIAVSAGDATILAPAATNGAATVIGILFGNVDATAADTDCTIVYQQAVVKSLVWPAGITVAQQAAATAELEAMRIVIAAT